MGSKFGTKLFAGVLLSLAVISIVGVKSASAFQLIHYFYRIPPPASAMPADIRAWFENCGYQNTYSPIFQQWLSPAGTPSVTGEITVPYGTTTVPLTLTWASTVCWSPNTVPQSRLQTFNARVVAGGGSVTGWQGQGLDLSNGTSQGHYFDDGYTFTYNAGAPMTTDRNIVIEFDNRSINRFSNGQFICIAVPRPSAGGGWNFDRCPPERPFFGMRIRVANPPTPSIIDCNSAQITPSIPQPGENFSIRASFTTRNGTPATQEDLYTVHISLNGPGGSTGNFVNRLGSAFGRVRRAGGYGEGTVPGVFSPTPAVSIPTPGVYNGTYVVNMGGASNSPRTCPFQVSIANRPYHRVYGGDVYAGAGFRNGTNCRRDNDARIYGSVTGSGPLPGAGSQLAAFALGRILDFPTGNIRTNANDFDHLSFANTNPSTAGLGTGSPFGGGLDDDYLVCAPNYYSLGPAGTDLGNDATVISGNSDPVIQARGNVVIEGRTLGAGAKQTIYVDGNAFITGNIQFASGGVPSYANRAAIPSFRLIVKGNIFVEPNVGRIDGIYAAQPDEAVPGDNQGRFYTCGARAFPAGPGVPNPYAYAPNANQLNGACASTGLTVYGAVIAEVVKLTRTNGSVRQSAVPGETYNAGGAPAEVFVFSPEVWLNGAFSGSGEFDSVTALPPVL